jgi:hypothetical protein
VVIIINLVRPTVIYLIVSSICIWSQHTGIKTVRLLDIKIVVIIMCVIYDRCSAAVRVESNWSIRKVSTKRDDAR